MSDELIKRMADLEKPAARMARPPLAYLQVSAAMKAMEERIAASSRISAGAFASVHRAVERSNMAAARSLKSANLAWIGEMRDTVAQLRKTASALAIKHESFAKLAAAQNVAWTRAIRLSAPSFPKIPSFAPAVQKALISRSMAFQSLSETLMESTIRQATAASLFAPQRTFSRFAINTFAKMRATTDETSSRTLRCSLGLAESQMLGSSALLQGIIPASGRVQGAVAPNSFRPKLVVPFLQRQELLESAVDLDEGDIGAAILASPTAQIEQLARSVLELVTRCNEAARVRFGHDIFKPTNRILESFSNLPWTIALDKKTLGEVVDYLFWIFYDGAGDDKLRFHVNGGGPLGDGEIRAVYCVKFLRNKWLRHDPDHGKESKIEKSWKDVGETLADLGISNFPVSAGDFRIIHRRLLEELHRFLETLLSRLAGGKRESKK